MLFQNTRNTFVATGNPSLRTLPGSTLPCLDFHCVEGKVNEFLDIICGKYSELQNITHCVFSGDTHTSHEFHVNKIHNYSGDPSDFYYFIDDYTTYEGETTASDILTGLHFQASSPFFFTTGALMNKRPAFREIGADGFPQKDLLAEMAALELPEVRTAHFSPGYVSCGYLPFDDGVEAPLQPQDHILLQCGGYRLVWQKDGNLVMRGPLGIVWQTNTAGKGTRVCFQADGNIMIYKGDTPYIDTASNNQGITKLKLFNNGSMVLCDSADRFVMVLTEPQPVFQALEKGRLPFGAGLVDSLTNQQPVVLLRAGDYALKWQRDGDLALYGPGGRKWHTGTANRGDQLKFQADGNLVVLQNNVARWTSNSAGKDVARLVLTSAGHLYLATGDNTQVTHLY